MYEKKKEYCYIIIFPFNTATNEFYQDVAILLYTQLQMTGIGTLLKNDFICSVVLLLRTGIERQMQHLFKEFSPWKVITAKNQSVACNNLTHQLKAFRSHDRNYVSAMFFRSQKFFSQIMKRNWYSFIEVFECDESKYGIYFLIGTHLHILDIFCSKKAK